VVGDDAVATRDRYRRGVIVGVILLYAVAVLVFTDRTLPFGSRAMILPGASIPTASAPAGYAEALDQYGVHLPKHGDRAIMQSAPLAPPDRLRFGYSGTETSILGAPYWFGKDDGHVVYYETLREFVYAPVNDDYMRKVGLPGPMPLSSQCLGLGLPARAGQLGLVRTGCGPPQARIRWADLTDRAWRRW
jgi:hypothetical protein